MHTHQNEEILTTYTTDIDDSNVSVVCVCGELDATSASTFLSDLHDVIARHRSIIMDVHLLEYVDSTGVAAIFSVKNAVSGTGRGLCLVGCHGLLRKILHAIHVEDEIACYEDIDSAMSDKAQWHTS